MDFSTAKAMPDSGAGCGRVPGGPYGSPRAEDVDEPVGAGVKQVEPPVVIGVGGDRRRRGGRQRRSPLDSRARRRAGLEADNFAGGRGQEILVAVAVKVGAIQPPEVAGVDPDLLGVDEPAVL